ncbi:hypothetical protein QBC38DRAFT_489685 [Podospora fimiseda]|uniref:Extracellular membrane protein CFEM domain-containing protein n=1 Tax=Podospora fimiseda TaxID=252190 RepID=A0AAN6YT28_9PEZI|nr:hypothetical protein QBC38DRAFT_489685 [Podospora fimiseda]
MRMLKQALISTLYVGHVASQNIFIDQVPAYHQLPECAEPPLSAIVRGMEAGCGDGRRTTSYYCFCVESTQEFRSIISTSVLSKCAKSFPTPAVNSALDVFSKYCHLTTFGQTNNVVIPPSTTPEQPIVPPQPTTTQVLPPPAPIDAHSTSDHPSPIIEARPTPESQPTSTPESSRRAIQSETSLGLETKTVKTTDLPGDGSGGKPSTRTVRVVSSPVPTPIQSKSRAASCCASITTVSAALSVTFGIFVLLFF